MESVCVSYAVTQERDTVCVYFWLSASVSMAADASQRKALRYQHTLVSHCLYMPLFLSPVVLWSYLRRFAVCLFVAALLRCVVVNLIRSDPETLVWAKIRIFK